MPTIYIDCTSTRSSRVNTGIQRVVRNIARWLPEVAPRLEFSAVPVVFENGGVTAIDAAEVVTPAGPGGRKQRLALRLHVRLLGWVDDTRSFLVELFPSPKWKTFVMAPRYRPGLAWCVLLPLMLPATLIRRLRRRGGQVEVPAAAAGGGAGGDVGGPGAGDILLLADATWGSADVWPAVRRFRARGAYVVLVVYDLIPLSHPECFEQSLVNAFTRWLADSLDSVDFYVCISHATELALLDFLRDAARASGTLSSAQTAYFHLGSDLNLARAKGAVAPEVEALVAGDAPIFLVVGSLEPRKNLAFVLDAFDIVWQRDPHTRLVLVGHNVWKAGEFIARIDNHPRLGTCLFWLRHASDDDLERLYREATALVIASRIEGFGLPIVEAMQRGLPVICSDIPVFREIADGKATFFSLATTDELVAAICRVASEQANGTAPERRPYPWLSWRESTDVLLDMLAVHFQPGHGKGGGACG